MKKIIPFALLLCLSSCATVLGGHIDQCQKVKPPQGGREVRVGALIADVFIFPPLLIVDFCTNAIYKPCKPEVKK